MHQGGCITSRQNARPPRDSLASARSTGATPLPVKQSRTRFRLNQSQVLTAGIGTVLGVLVVVPLAILLVTSLQVGTTLAFPPPALSLDRYEQVFGDAVTYRLLLNTVGYALGSIALALPPATLLSWLVGRTDLPGRDIVRNVAFTSFAMPGLIAAFGWILLASPRSGALNVLLRATVVPGLSEGPLDVYTLPGMVFVTAIALVPGFFTLLIAVFERMDPALEEAAAAAGASRFTITRRITFPLLLPGFLATIVFYMVVLMQTFEIPLAIGTSAQVPVLSTRIFILTQPEFGNIDYGLAGAFATITLMVGIGLLALYFRATRLQARYQVVGGRGYRVNPLRLGPWRGPALAFVVVLFLAQLVLPVLILLWTALLPFYQPPSIAALPFVSLNTFAVVLSKPRVLLSFGNTATLVLVAATGTMLLASVIAWLAQQRQRRAGWFLDLLGFIPLAIPGVVMALALFLLFVRTPLYGTVWLIVIGHVVSYLPFSIRLMGVALIQLRRELEEAARTSGVGPIDSFTRIVLPLVLPSLMDGWIWVFAHSLRDFTFPLMFRTTQNVVIATLIWELWNQPDTPGAAALSVLLVVTVLATTVLLRSGTARLFAARGMNRSVAAP